MNRKSRRSAVANLSRATSSIEEALGAVRRANLDQLPAMLDKLQAETDRVGKLADALTDDAECLLMELNVQRDSFLATLQEKLPPMSNVREVEASYRRTFEYKHLKAILEEAPEPKEHWSFRKLVEMGRDVTSLIIHDLTFDNIELWHPILIEIIGETVDDTPTAWKDWLIYQQRGG